MSTSGVIGDTPPCIDGKCSRHLTFRDLIACGDTYLRLFAQAGAPPLVLAEQLPTHPSTWAALHGLATQILDPLIDRYGGLRLTYGFSGAWLAPRASRPKAPQLDQHAACELNRAGRPICQRGGAAVDFVVPGQTMDVVATWVVGNLPFDRLYYYGEARPVHVSWHAQPRRLPFAMRPRKNGGLIPQRLTPALLGALGGSHA